MIYFYHIPKTGGTSANMAFLSLGGHDGDALYGVLGSKKDHVLCVDNRRFIGWNTKLIRTVTNYFYAFSHVPFYKVAISLDAFTVTCLRRPEDRVLSHYKELLSYRQLGLEHSANETEGLWLGDSFEYYLINTPLEFLNGQTYMFSEKGSVNEAEDVIQGLSFRWFTEEFGQGIERLAQILDLPLKKRHDRRSLTEFVPSEKEAEMLSEILKPDRELYRRLHDQ